MSVTVLVNQDYYESITVGEEIIPGKAAIVYITCWPREKAIKAHIAMAVAAAVLPTVDFPNNQSKPA
ncbi:hypothetical protein J6590_062238 [Homalodisca vitripennis]|nr:hypothetical protein J6590_062238 [Homalodisca vitripennis]